MDVSKLPRLSETDKHAPPPAQTPSEVGQVAPSPADRSMPVQRVSAGVGAEVWLSLIIGIVLMMIGQSFARYSFAKLRGQPFHTNVKWAAGPKEGQEVEYFELEGFTAWTDTGIFLFGLAMVLEAAMLTAIYSRLGGKRALTGFALFVTILATGLNVYVCVKLFGVGIMPLMSAMAVAFGGYMAIYEWRLLQQLSAAPPR